MRIGTQFRILTIVVGIIAGGDISAHDISDWMNVPTKASPWKIHQEQQKLVALSNLSLEQKNNILFLANKDYRLRKAHISVCFSPPPNTGNQAEVAFDQEVQAKIVRIAPLWLQGTNLVFDFGQSKALNQCQEAGDNMSTQYDIRILTYRGYTHPDTFTSLIGNQAHTTVLADVPHYYSVILAFDPDHDFWKKQSEFYILHEIGHALGALHEHQRVSCLWDKEEIKKRKITPFIGPNADKAIEKNLLEFDQHIESILGIVSTKWDKNSVMAYNFQSWYFKNGEQDICFRAPVNTLSPDDIAGIHALYADLDVGVTELEGAVRGGRPFTALSSDLQAHFSDKRFGRPNGGSYDQKIASLPLDERPSYKRRIESKLSLKERAVLEQVLAVRTKYEKSSSLGIHSNVMDQSIIR